MRHLRRNVTREYFGKIFENATKISQALEEEANEKSAKKGYANQLMQMIKRVIEWRSGKMSEIAEKRASWIAKIAYRIFARKRAVTISFANI